MAIYFEDVDASAEGLEYLIDVNFSGTVESVYQFKVQVPSEQWLPSENFQDLADAFALAVANAMNTYSALITNTTTKRGYTDVGASTPVTTL